MKLNKTLLTCSAAILTTVMAACGGPSPTPKSSSSTAPSSVSSSSSSAVVTSSSSSSSSRSSVISSSSSQSAGLPFQTLSASFTAGSALPDKYSCNGKAFGEGVSPEVHWTPGPEGTKSYAIIFKDLTLGTGGYHWAMWNIPYSINVMPESTPGGSPASMGSPTQKSAVGGDNKYFGPCPNSAGAACNTLKTDTYVFTIYALGVEKPAIATSDSVQAIETKLKAAALATTEIKTTSNARPGTACATTSSSRSSSSAASSSSAGIDGAALYTSKCSGCHGTSKRGASATLIKSAITSNKGGMGSLSALTAAELAAIDALQ